MKNFSLALGLAALVAIVAGCGGGSGGSQLPSPGAAQLVSYHSATSGIHADIQPDTGRNAKWWAYYYCGASSICRYHTSYFYGLVTTYLRSETGTWKDGQSPWLALVVTGNTTLTGDLSAATLNDTVNVTTSGKNTPFGSFQYQGEPSCSGGPAASTRFFIISGGLFAYTHYWWSNGVSWTLKKDSPTTISQKVNDPGNWSDWNGKPGTYQPARFANAIKHVRWVGLSFGGGCFFENGVDVSGPKNAIFNSTFTE